LMRLRLHDVGDAEPLLMPVFRLDHEQHEYACAGPGRAPARVIEGTIAFRRPVDDDEVFRLVPRLVAAALGAHCPPPAVRPTFGTARSEFQCCHGGRAVDKRQFLIYRRTKPTMSLTAFNVSAAIA